MLATWAAISLTGCAVGMSYSSDGEGGRMSVGAGVGRAASDTLDRSQIPDVGRPPSMELPEIQDYRLSDGMRVVLVERHEVPLVSLELQVRGGASAQSPEEAGLAALTADMLDEGTQTRSALEIADAVDLLGASLSTTAGYDDSSVRLSVLRPRFEEGLAIVADIVVNPTFPTSELERVKKERLGRVIQRSDQPAALADDAFARVLYGPEHPYGEPLLGTAKTLEALTRDDVVAFHRERYAPGQATLVVVGDVTRETLDSLLTTAFTGWSGHGRDVPVPTASTATSGRHIYIVDRPGSAQSEIRVGRVAVARSTDEYYPLVVLNTVLGGSFTSRLNQKLREEKGYTYGAHSYFDMRRGPGPFEASAAVATAVTDSAVLEFVREIDRVGDEPVADDELTRARNYLALRLPQRFESDDDVARMLSGLVRYDVAPDFYSDYVSDVLAVTAGDVRRAADDELGSRDMAIVVAGDRAAIEEPLKRLGLGPVTVLPATTTDTPNAEGGGA